MKVITEIDLENVDLLSTIYLSPKRKVESRMILIIIKAHQFKMDTFESALTIITPNCFMSSVDI